MGVDGEGVGHDRDLFRRGADGELYSYFATISSVEQNVLNSFGFEAGLAGLHGVDACGQAVDFE